MEYRLEYGGVALFGDWEYRFAGAIMLLEGETGRGAAFEEFVREVRAVTVAAVEKDYSVGVGVGCRDCVDWRAARAGVHHSTE